MDQVKHERTISPATLHMLRHGEIVVEGLLPYSSNYTMLAWVGDDNGQSIQAVYKPRRGERPLWDFPHGTLYRREIATYLVSESLGFSFVPPTVARHGPFGIGSIQLFIDHDPDAHLLTMYQEKKYQQDILRLAAFDHLINNADRKSGHVLKGTDGHLWAIDHGICFHHEDKLRTVLWDFAGLTLPDDVIRAFQTLHTNLTKHHRIARQLSDLLDDSERHALYERLASMIKCRTYPIPSTRFHIPWPPV